ERVCDERMSEELDTVRTRFVFMPNPVGRSRVDAVGNCVRALRRLPCLYLRVAPFVLLRRMPADRRWKEDDLGTEQRSYARGLRIPLVPADQNPNGRITCFPYTEAGGTRVLVTARVRRNVTRHEVELLVEERIIRDMHFPIDAEHAAVCVYHRGGVAVDARCLTLEYRGDDHYLEFPGKLLHALHTRPRNRLREVEAICRLPLAEVGCIVQLLQADNLRSTSMRFAHPLHRLVHGCFHVVGNGHLNEAYSEWLVCHLETPAGKLEMSERGCRSAL